MATPLGSIEILENRIAPAVFFVSAAAAGANALTVHKGSELAGTTSDEVDARNFTQATQAVLLSKGDVLVLDVDDNLALSTGDITLMTVTSGKAMVFLTDTALGTVGAFDVNDLTGIAYGKDFAATVKTDINGDVLGALTDAGKLNANGSVELIPGVNLKGLEVNGRIYGSIQGGGNISGVKITSEGNDASVIGIFTGTKKTNSSTLSGVENAGFTLGYTPAAGTSGGNISNVTLSHGALYLGASNGANTDSGKAGVGGSISNVTYSGLGAFAESFRIEAGDGGTTITQSAPTIAGAGGSISNVTISGSSNGPSLEFSAGSGGNGGTVGGNGGSVVNLTVNLASVAEGLIISAGDGGSGGYIPKGTKAGAGGSLSKIKITGTTFADDISLYGGNGGDTLPYSDAAAGGAGGNITDVSITAVNGQLLELYAGDAGLGLKNGATGGSISKVVANLTGEFETIEFTGGAGGIALGAKGNAGAGGSIASVTLKVNEISDYISIYGGNGGDSLLGTSGAGGAITGLNVIATGTVGNTGLNTTDDSFYGLEIISGDGGLAGSTGGVLPAVGGGPSSKGGASGAVSKVLVQGTTIAFIEISSGDGGSGVQGVALGAGSSGAITAVDVVLSEGTATGAHVHSGVGGAVASGPSNNIFGVGNGGNSGAVKDISISTGAADSGLYEIYAGVATGDLSGGAKAMAAVLPGYKGGDVGGITSVEVNAPAATVYVGKIATAGLGGFLFGGTGGNAGDVSKIKVTASVVGIAAASGGLGLTAGGKGGSVKGVNVSITAGADHFLHYVAAGDAGGGLKSGVAGSVSNIFTNGNIGNFAATAGFAVADDDGYLPLDSIGGIFAGRGYKLAVTSAAAANGNVTNVSAAKISAIMAGISSSSQLGFGNAVFKIAKITTQSTAAQTVGVDSDGDGEFDFQDTNADGIFQLGLETPIDGLVIVKQGGYAGDTAKVLKLVEVTPEELEEVNVPSPA